MGKFIQDDNNDEIKKIKVTFLKSFKLCMALASLLHIFFSILFFIEGIEFLGIFNIFSAIMYFLFFLHYVKTNLVATIVLTVIEVSLHSTLCAYFIGWKGGFYVYPLSLIPVIYFVSINILRKEIYGHIIIGITVLNYQLTKIITNYRQIAEFEFIFDRIEEPLYTFNTVCASFIFIFLVYSFLTEMKNIQQDLENKNDVLKNIANIDQLTNISNRRHMNEKLKFIIQNFEKNNEIFSIAICDIDNFKNINDTYGHNCGDIILKAIADILKFNCQKFDIEVCRWGGEEFLILLKNSDLQKSKKICEKILNDIRNYETRYNEEIVKVTMTFGIGEFNPTNNDIEQVLKIADINLYKGKKSTKNGVVI